VKLILKSFQSPGDIVLLTAAVRDLHRSSKGAFITDVRTPCHQLWNNNPFVSSICDEDPGAKVINCEYPLIHQSNAGPWHFIHGYSKFLSARLDIEINPTNFRGRHLSLVGRERMGVTSSGGNAKPRPVLDHIVWWKIRFHRKVSHWCHIHDYLCWLL
jgi:hypothetical protein